MDVTLPSIKTDVPSRMPGWGNFIWDRLTAPHVTISEANDQRQARLTAAVILLLLALFVFEAIFVPFAAGFEELLLPIVVTCAGLLATYLLTRLRYYQVGAALAMVVLALSVLGQVAALPRADATDLNLFASLIWLVLPILLGGLLLTPLALIVVSVISVGGVVAAGSLEPFAYTRSITGAVTGFVATVALIVLIVRYVQERYLVRPQLRVLQETGARLARKNRDLEQANREIREFAYIIAHDIRAPLVNFNGFINEAEFAFHELLPALRVGLPQLEEPVREKARRAAEDDMPEALAYLQTNSALVHGLVEQVLKIARVGRHEVKLEAVNLRVLVDGLRESLNHQLTEREATLTLGHLPTILADRSLMQQTLSNLLENAIKYLEPGRPGQIRIFAEELPGEIIIHVQDNGRGIAHEDYERVFQLFRRARNVGDVPGDGFGLSYVQSIIQRQGGRIWFDSTLGAGSTFRFSLPVPSEVMN